MYSPVSKKIYKGFLGKENIKGQKKVVWQATEKRKTFQSHY
jgi:hypothetical protein